MRGLRNFIVGAISTLGVNQTILAIGYSFSLNFVINSLLNTLVSIIGGILSAVTVAYFQHRWRMNEEKRKLKKDEKISLANSLTSLSKFKRPLQKS